MGLWRFTIEEVPAELSEIMLSTNIITSQGEIKVSSFRVIYDVLARGLDQPSRENLACPILHHNSYKSYIGHVEK